MTTPPTSETAAHGPGHWLDLFPQVRPVMLGDFVRLVLEGNMQFPPEEETGMAENDALSRSETRHLIAMLVGVPPVPQLVQALPWGNYRCLPHGLTPALTPALQAAIRFSSGRFCLPVVEVVDAMAQVLEDDKTTPSLRLLESLDGMNFNTLPHLVRTRFNQLPVTLVIFPRNVPENTISELGWMAW
jgi:hypothetical protein